MEEKLRICTFIVRMDSNLSLISKYFDYRSEIPVYSSELELWEQGNSVLKVISTESRVRTRLQLSFPPFCFKRVPSFCPLSLSVSAEGKMGSSSKEDAGTDGDTSSGDTAPANSNLFSEGERVLAYHGPRVYEAKVQKAELRKKEWKYFVHYLGWNKNWDEWVSADRLMKHNEENIMKQQALEKKLGVDKSSKSARSAQAKAKSSTDAKVDKEDLKSNVAKGKKRKVESGIEKDNLSVEKLVKIQIPSTLKKQLVDDWEFVTQQDKLVKLPRSPSIDDILTKYLEYRTKKDGMVADSIGEILKGIRCYFDKALPVILLYKKERQQYQETVGDDVSPSTVYGAEHLLRLFVKLPELLAYVNIEEETLTRLQQKLLDLLKFLQKNQSTFFVSAYDASRCSESKGKDKGD
ncbi:protein MRG1 [Carica papaya]|uniref:protein MRG1 n=1 Tax=Carica papaya TaxID=3649 RepID=UPI000B8C92D4|nr:protein MRG1 [Carica papaya]